LTAGYNLMPLASPKDNLGLRFTPSYRLTERSKGVIIGLKSEPHLNDLSTLSQMSIQILSSLVRVRPERERNLNSSGKGLSNISNHELRLRGARSPAGEG
jgi:hypothetical protein